MMNIHFYLVVTWGEVVTHDILFYIDINIYCTTFTVNVHVNEYLTTLVVQRIRCNCWLKILRSQVQIHCIKDVSNYLERQ